MADLKLNSLKKNYFELAQQLFRVYWKSAFYTEKIPILILYIVRLWFPINANNNMNK